MGFVLLDLWFYLYVLLFVLLYFFLLASVLSVILELPPFGIFKLFLTFISLGQYLWFCLFYVFSASFNNILEADGLTEKNPLNDSMFCFTGNRSLIIIFPEKNTRSWHGKVHSTQHYLGFLHQWSYRPRCNWTIDASIHVSQRKFYQKLFKMFSI